MEQALIALVSLGVTLTIYFDRVRRKDMSDGFARVEKHVDKRFEAVDKQFEAVDKQFEAVDKQFEQVQRQIKQVNKQVDKRFEQVQLQINESNKQVNESIGGLTKSVVELARGVGRAEGRTELLAAAE